VNRDLIASSAFFNGLPDAEIDALAQVASDREFAAGETLMAEGDFGYAVYVIRSGSADIVHARETIATAGPGDVVGEVGVLAGRRTASVVATTPIEALGLFKRDVWKLEQSCPGAAERLRAAMEQHTQHA
jgi:voltage-gated potassium channel